MDGAPVEKEEVEEKAATNLIDVDNLIEISLKWNVHIYEVVVWCWFS